MGLTLHVSAGASRRAAHAWLLASLFANGAWAAGLTLPEAVGRAVDGAPTVAAAAAGFDAAGSAMQGAALRPPWESSLSVENFAGGGEARGFDAAEVTVEVGRTLESPIKIQARIDGAQASLILAQADLNQARVERFEAALSAFFDAWAAQERIAIVREVTQRSDEVVSLAGRRVESGRSSEAELAMARSASAQARLELRSEESRSMHAKQALALLLQQPRNAPAAVDWDGSLQSLDRWMPVQPVAVASAQAASQQAKASVALAESQRIADWQVAAGVRRLEEMDTQALVFSVSRPWGSRDRARPAIDEASANLRRAEALAAAAAQDAQLQQHKYRAEIEVRRLELEALRQTIIPEAEHALTVYRRGYGLGRFSLIEVTNAERELLAARLRTVDARRSLALAETGYRLVAGAWLEAVEHD